MNPTYSVVIPAYNAEKHIEACLNSVSMQITVPLEVLVIDDHSLDGTAEAVRRCEERFSIAGIRLEYLRLPKNSGPSVARNIGIHMAKGSHIAFLDADDIWSNDKLLIINRFINNSNLGLIFHSYTEEKSFDSRNSFFDYQASPLSIYRMLLRNPAQTSCAVIRNNHELKFNETMSYCEDYDLWMQIAETSNVVRLIGYPLTRLGRPQLTAGGLSGNTSRMRIGEIRVYYNFCRRFWLTRFWLLPFLIFFSFFKHLYSRLR